MNAPRLTPFVERLRDDVTEALRHALGVPEAIEVGWRDAPLSKREGVGRLTVSLRLPDGAGVELDLSDRAPGRDALAEGGGLWLSAPRRPDGVDPLGHPDLRRVLAGLRRRLSHLADRDLTVHLVPALEIARRFEGVEDFMYAEPPQPGGTHGYLRLGFRCNQDCGFCWQGRDWPDAPPELAERYLDELAALGVTELGITGGEPTLFRHLPDLVRRAREVHGMSVFLETNAIRLAKPAYRDRLIEAGLAAVFVSYHSHLAEASDAMTRAPGTHRRTVDGIVSCLDGGLRVLLNCVVERSNYDHLPDHARDIVERFVDPHPRDASRGLASVTYSHPSSSHDLARFREQSVPVEELRGGLVEAIRILRAAGVTVDAGGSCGFPPCTFIDAPELAQWVDVDMVSGEPGRVHVEACEPCAGRARCLGLRSEYVELHGPGVARPFERLGDP